MRNKWRSVAIVSVIGTGFMLWKLRKRSNPRLQGYYHMYLSHEEMLRESRMVKCNVSGIVLPHTVRPFLDYAKSSNMVLGAVGRPKIHVFVREGTPDEISSLGGDDWYVSGFVQPNYLVSHVGGSGSGEELQAAVGHAFGKVSAECHPQSSSD